MTTHNAQKSLEFRHGSQCSSTAQSPISLYTKCGTCAFSCAAWSHLQHIFTGSLSVLSELIKAMIIFSCTSYSGHVFYSVEALPLPSFPLVRHIPDAVAILVKYSASILCILVLLMAAYVFDTVKSMKCTFSS